MNLFQFVNNNSINNIDPFGLLTYPFADNPNSTDYPPGTVIGIKFGPTSDIGSVIGEAAQDIWNLPNTTIGIGLGELGELLGGDKPSRTGGGTLEYPNSPIMFEGGAITLGGVIIYDDIFGANPGLYKPFPSPYTGCPINIQEHERHHAEGSGQYQFWGPFYIPIWIISRPSPFLEYDADNHSKR